jgi:hypothetical protein
MFCKRFENTKGIIKSRNSKDRQHNGKKKKDKQQSTKHYNLWWVGLGVKPLIHQSELRTYMKVVPFKEKSSFHFVVL